jgi:circadian clock protein KaiC
VLTILCGSQQGFMSIGGQPGVDISYLSDTILLLGYFENDGELRRYVSAVKRRQGEHQTTIRELKITSRGVRLGEPLRQFRNIVLNNAVRDSQGSDDTDDT